MNHAAGKKEVCEAVLIAALVALAQALIGFGVEETKRHIAEKREAKKKKDAPDE